MVAALDDGRERAVSDDVAEILGLADDLEAAGDFMEAAKVLHAMLQAQGPTAPVLFMLAELLAHAGELTLLLARCEPCDAKDEARSHPQRP